MRRAFGVNNQEARPLISAIVISLPAMRSKPTPESLVCHVSSREERKEWQALVRPLSEHSGGITLDTKGSVAFSSWDSDGT